MEITNVNIYVVENNQSVKANGDIELEGSIKLKFALRSGRNGLFIAWKGQEKYFDKKEQKDKWNSPIVVSNKELLEEMTARVIAEYETKVGRD